MSEWTNVKNKLPPENEIVLLAHGLDRCKAGYLTHENGPSEPPQYYGVGGTNIRHEVHHWKPYEEPPKAEYKFSFDGKRLMFGEFGTGIHRTGDGSLRIDLHTMNTIIIPPAELRRIADLLEDKKPTTQGDS